MALEIERKFLVDKTQWEGLKKPAPARIAQAYLSKDITKTVRVRIKGDKAFLTIKGKTEGISRQEFEYEVPVADARALIKLCDDSPLDKDRYVMKVGETSWEVDVFYGVNEGLILAEVELESENAVFEIPDWVAKEVSDDPRFYNVNLMENPYSTW